VSSALLIPLRHSSTINGLLFRIVESTDARMFGLDEAEVQKRRRYVGHVRKEIEVRSCFQTLGNVLYSRYSTFPLLSLWISIVTDR